MRFDCLKKVIMGLCWIYWWKWMKRKRILPPCAEITVSWIKLTEWTILVDRVIQLEPNKIKKLIKRPKK
jgi:hypothetical protein